MPVSRVGLSRQNMLQMCLGVCEAGESTSHGLGRAIDINDHQLGRIR